MNETTTHAPDLDPDPDPAFLQRLEWQVATEARRHRRFGGSVSRTALHWRSPRSLAALCLLAVAATSVGAVGAIAIAGPATVNARMAEVRATTRLEVAGAAETMAQMNLDEARARFEAGVIGTADLIELERQALRARTEVRLAESILREVMARRSPAVESIGARTVRGTDYVGERLRIRLEQSVEVEQLAAAGFELSTQRFEAGMIPAEELETAEGEAADARREARVLAELIDLRTAVVGDTILPVDAELRGREIELEAERERLLGAQERCAGAAEVLRVRFEHGVIGPGALREMETRRSTLDAASRLTTAELEIIRRLQADRS